MTKKILTYVARQTWLSPLAKHLRRFGFTVPKGAAVRRYPESDVV